MNRSKLFAVALLTCLSQTALAEGSGFYVGAGIADGSLTACSTTGTCTNFTASSQDKANLRVIGGYDFNKFIGIEAGISQLGTFKVKNNALTTVGSSKISAVTLAAKGGYKFQSGFSIFGKLGLANVSSQYSADPGWTFTGNSNQSATGLLMGLGGQYNFTDMIGLRLNIEFIGYSDSTYTGGVGGTNLLAVFKF